MTFKEYIYRISSSFGIKLFSKFFPEYFASEPLSPSERYLEYPFVVKNLPKLPARILDVGSSGCYFPLILAAFGYETFSIDIRPYPILNKIAFKNFTFFREDIRQSHFADNFFDAVTAISTIEHIGLGGRYGMAEDIDADENTVREMERVLKPGGVLLITLPYGKGKIIRPFHIIYDKKRIDKITGQGLLVEEIKYYMHDQKGDWVSCTEEEAGVIDVKKEDYAVCFLKLRKK
jgi:SAM-dependent methyltransferase